MKAVAGVVAAAAAAAAMVTVTAWATAAVVVLLVRLQVLAATMVTVAPTLAPVSVPGSPWWQQRLPRYESSPLMPCLVPHLVLGLYFNEV
eukprot:545098-Pleurochrysis_carterae.AAC.3